jgi:arginyl-tRNA synthetase
MRGAWILVWTELTDGLRSALERLGLATPHRLQRIELVVPRDASHGDWTTNLALWLGKEVGQNPRALAQAIAEHLPPDPERFDPPEIAGPGFLNFRYSARFVDALPASVVAADHRFGAFDHAHGTRVLVEYVSANPTGPMNVVSARTAAVGSTLVRLLDATGHVAHGEFYVNDAGNQVDLLGASVAARFAERVGVERAFPEQGYRGAYITELAAALPDAEARAQLAAADGGLAWFRARALEQMVAWQQRDLAHYGVTFERWFRESTLHESGAVLATLAELETRGMTYRSNRPLEMSEAAQGRAPESAGSGEATYLRTCRFGDDMDRVVLRSNGTPTYLLPDIAYHRDKHARGAAIAINLWGPDHHAYVATMKAGLAALGLPPAFLEVLIVQQVNLLSAGQQVKMSKRAGEFVTLRELVDEVGADCAKFFFLMRSTSAHLDFDLDLAKRQNDDNPAFYVQYAHARVASVLRNAGAAPAGGPRAPLVAAAERSLARMLAVYPEVVRGAAFAREPHRIPVYLQQVAAEFHRFYHECRILADEPAVRASRLALSDAVRVVLRNGLALMGVSAPERMERAAEVEA